MSRVKRGVTTRKRHKRVLKQAKGFWGQRKNVFRRAKETLLRAMRFAYIGRKLKKRNFRRLFTMRVNAACRAHGLSYSRFIHLLKQKNIMLNRKMLAQMAVFDNATFAHICSMVNNSAGAAAK